MKRKRAALYYRVSTAEQTVEPQRHEVKTFAERANYVFEEYVDHAQSGSRRSRPALDRMMAEVRRRKVDVIVVASLDRLGRSLSHLVNLLEELRQLDVQLVCLREGWDSNTATGKLMLQLVAVFAEYERTILVERTLRGMDSARRNGTYIGGRKRRLDEAKLLSYRRAGFGIRKIAKTMNAGIGTIMRRLEELGDPLKDEDE